MEIPSWKFKKNAKSQGSSNGFWYDIGVGGYISPEDVLSDDAQVLAIENAVNLLFSFEQALENANLLNEF